MKHQITRLHTGAHSKGTVMAKHTTWSLEDHLCRFCGGRILRRASGPSVMTPSGNPIFRCADCGRQTSAMGPDALCWCGFVHRGQRLNAYVCVPFSALENRPDLRRAVLACGCDPDNQTSEVGIALERDCQAPTPPSQEGGE